MIFQFRNVCAHIFGCHIPIFPLSPQKNGYHYPLLEFSPRKNEVSGVGKKHSIADFPPLMSQFSPISPRKSDYRKIDYIVVFPHALIVVPPPPPEIWLWENLLYNCLSARSNSSFLSRKSDYRKIDYMMIFLHALIVVFFPHPPRKKMTMISR